MNRYHTIQEAIEDLKDCSDIIKELIRLDCFCAVTFGMQDAVNGYGWSYGMIVKVVRHGRKCTRPGCYYDETKPAKVLMKDEREFVLAGKSHRHSYTEVEKTIGFWYGIHEDTTIRQFLENQLNEAKQFSNYL